MVRLTDKEQPEMDWMWWAPDRGPVAAASPDRSLPGSLEESPFVDVPRSQGAAQAPVKSAVTEPDSQGTRTRATSLHSLFTGPAGNSAARRARRRRNPQRPAPSPEPGPDEIGALRADVLRLKAQVKQMELQLANRSPVPDGAGGRTSTVTQLEMQAAEKKLQKEMQSHQHRMQQLEEDVRNSQVQMLQVISAREEETGGALKAQLGGMQQQLHRLCIESKRRNLVIHAPAGCGHQQLLDHCNAVLPSSGAHSLSITASALRSMTTQSTSYSLWHLQMDSEPAKHALLGRSKDLRRVHVFLDDDLTKQQLEGRQALGSKRLQLRGMGHRTWWRRDKLFWADATGVHSCLPAST